MFKGKNILVIGDAWQYIEFYLIEKLHLNIILFQEFGKEENDKPKLYKELYYLDFSNKTKYLNLAKKLHEIYNFSCVVSYNDKGTIIACEISNLLGLPCNSSFAVNLVDNKGELRRFLKNNSLSNIEYFVVKKGEKFTRKDIFPCVAKPIDGLGSINVKLIKNYDDLQKYLRDAKSDTILEEYLDGPEVSVETISFEGKHSILQITDKFTENFIEIGHAMPSQFSSNYELRQLILDFLDLINEENGPCHIEVKMTKKGPKIVEAHTRPGGDFIVLLLAEIFGVDVLCLPIQYFITNQIPSFSINNKGAGCVLYFNSNPGKIISIEGYEEVNKDPRVINYEINIKPGDVVKKFDSSFTRSGCIVVKGENVQDALKYGKTLLDKIKITVR